MEQCCCVLTRQVQWRERFEGVIAAASLGVEPIPREALFLAEKYFWSIGVAARAVSHIAVE